MARGLADCEVDGMRRYVYLKVTLPQTAHQKHNLNIRHSERCFLRIYFELTTVHCSRAMHRPTLLNYAATLAWREANTFLAVELLSGFGGLEVACWPLVPKFAGSNPAEAVGFLRVNKNPQHVGGQ